MSPSLPLHDALLEDYADRTAKVTGVNMVTDVTGVWSKTDEFL